MPSENANLENQEIETAKFSWDVFVLARVFVCLRRLGRSLIIWKRSLVCIAWLTQLLFSLLSILHLCPSVYLSASSSAVVSYRCKHIFGFGCAYRISVLGVSGACLACLPACSLARVHRINSTLTSQTVF